MAEFSHFRVHNDRQLPDIAGSAAPIHGNFLQNLIDNMRINILSVEKDTLEFEIIGIDASIANALRRIMLAEVCY
jgi:DNA-directed RNA polymerase I and III subunit RPAC1